ncbi:unnamed protein product [Ixodes hexagonus]
MASLALGVTPRFVQTLRLFPKFLPPGHLCPRSRNVHFTAYLLGVKGTELRMPSLSPTMTEGTIIKWLKNEGDPIQPGDVLCEIQTDKAVVAFEIEDPGTLAKILKDENSGALSVNTLIGIMVEEGEDWKDVDIPTSDEAPSLALEAKASIPAVPEKATTVAPVDGSATPAARRNLVGPAVKHLLDTYGLKPQDVPASGPHNVLLKADVIEFVQSKGVQKSSKPAQVSAPAPTVSRAAPLSTLDAAGENEYEDVPLTNMRRAIAKRLTLSKTTIPHSYMSVVCHIDETLQTRKKYAAVGVKVSVNDFIIKAVAMAIRRVPAMNVALQKDDSVQTNSSVDISVAVATDSGLITPIVKDADELGIDEISSTVRELAERARQGKLKPHEFEGGCFSISNLGMFGISEFSAVINPPQAAIMAIGSTKAIAGSDGRSRQAMAATLSYDARVVTDESVAEFLKAFKEHLEQPMNMLGLPVARHTEAQGS